jgi:hypothetical protein
MAAEREDVPSGRLDRPERQTPAIAHPCAQVEGAQPLTVLSQARLAEFTKNDATTFARVLDRGQREMRLNRGPIVTIGVPSAAV